MKLMDLSLIKLNDLERKIYRFDEIINNDNIIVLLGAPGSGKTSLLKKYENENKSTTQFLTIKKFINRNVILKNATKILLLDGIDEYKSVANDKNSVLSDIGLKINQLKKVKVVLSCREMDWYGERDKSSLEDEIDGLTETYSIEALNNSEKKELATLLKVEKPDAFIKKFTNLGFLENPQMYFMTAVIYKNNPNKLFKSKKELFLTFLKSSHEQNPEHENELESDEIVKYVGYLAFYYLMANIDTLDDDFVNKIASKENQYSKVSLNLVLKTHLFKDWKFCHRTIAEFALAYFLTKYKIQGLDEIQLNRVKSLFVIQEKVTSSLRGAYAWLCSLTKSGNLINIDPYYQAIHGDNSHFSNEQKKLIIEQVREYSNRTPYFFEFRAYSELEGFYNDELDSFFIKEFDDALPLKSHYIYFIIYSIITTRNLSTNMSIFLKDKVLAPNIPSHFKSHILRAFYNEIDFLLKVLKDLQLGQIADQTDGIKEVVMDYLYPNNVDTKQTLNVLHMYNKAVFGHCMYLNKTKYEDKYEIVDGIYKNYFDSENSKENKIPNNLSNFVSGYFLETILMFEVSLNAKEIYKILKHFDSYTNEFVSIKFETYTKHLLDKAETNKDNMVRLSNELFSIYVDDILDGGFSSYRIYTFNRFFNYCNPDKQSEILLNKINPTLSDEIKSEIFSLALVYSPKDKDKQMIVTNEVKDISKSHNLEKELELAKNPPKETWEIENEKRDQEEDKETEEKIKNNELYFSNKSDDQLIASFNDLFWIAEIFFLEREAANKRFLKTGTLERLRLVLTNAIKSTKISPELLTLKSLAKESPNANRNIDLIYYTSCALNKNHHPDDIEFGKYLYINNLSHTNTIEIIKGNYIDFYEKNNLETILGTLKEYAFLLLKNLLPKVSNALEGYIINETSISSLRDIIKLFGNGVEKLSNNLLSNILKIYNFNLKLQHLVRISKYEFDSDNNDIVAALITFKKREAGNFDINMAISLYKLITYQNDGFTNLEESKKVKLIDYMLCQFTTEDSITFNNGWQSEKDDCASFLVSKALNMFSVKSLKELLANHNQNDDIWKVRILQKISERQQQYSDNNYNSYSIDKLKSFILSDAILSYDDFFIEVCNRLNYLKDLYEDSRDREFSFFYNEEEVLTKKTEESCRDVISNNLKLKYNYDLEFIREKYEANNRVDINIKYKFKPEYEVQIECKRDDNPDIYKGIKKQLIDKYLSKNVKYGIYLIFDFGKRTNKELFEKRINKTIPNDYINNIKIITIDLKKHINFEN